MLTGNTVPRETHNRNEDSSGKQLDIQSTDDGTDADDGEILHEEGEISGE